MKKSYALMAARMNVTFQVGDKWEWTPYEKGIESDSRYKRWGKPRLWLPVTQDTLPADAPIWPGAKVRQRYWPLVNVTRIIKTN